MVDNRTATSRVLLPEPTLQRLPWYLSYVSSLRGRQVEYVSSTQISKELNVDASQIAKDLSFLNIRGKTRIGYEVAQLEKELQDFLGFKKAHAAVMIGVGSLGAALIQDSGLSRYGLNIVAGFDIDPRVIDTPHSGVPVFNISELNMRIPQLKAEIGIIAVPADQAQQVADAAITAGIKALWNFTPCRIRTAPDIVIQDTSMYSHLALIYNRLDTQAASSR
ncbi:MAG: redox-sensing transcriptional repressor Rex [Muribaculaceae bacterium]|nr:redox-sensing transcriptional repressor Rex [Muribaculaceae bacterium]